MFFACFHVARHINILELSGLILFVKQLVKRGRRRCRLLIGLDSKVALVASAKARSSSRSLNFHLRRLCELTVSFELSLVLFGLPTWGDPADAPSRLASLDD